MRESVLMSLDGEQGDSIHTKVGNGTVDITQQQWGPFFRENPVQHMREIQAKESGTRKVGESSCGEGGLPGVCNRAKQGRYPSRRLVQQVVSSQ